MYNGSFGPKGWIRLLEATSLNIHNSCAKFMMEGMFFIPFSHRNFFLPAEFNQSNSFCLSRAFRVLKVWVAVDLKAS